MTELAPDVEFLKFLGEGRFMLQRSRSSGRYVFYPRIMEPLTGAEDLEWVPAAGTGVVYATTTVRQREPKPSYNVSLIDLAEGVRLMSRVEGVDADKVRIGMPVVAKIVSLNDRAVLIFEVASPTDGNDQ